MRNLYEATKFSVGSTYVQCQIDDLVNITKSKSHNKEDENGKRFISVSNESFDMLFEMTEEDKREGCNAHYYKLKSFDYFKKVIKEDSKVILLCSTPNNNTYRQGSVCDVVGSKNFDEYELRLNDRTESIVTSRENFMVI